MSSTEFSPESPSPSLAGPSRKRPRSELSSEERKEARAHRNRIAAQNSRDRRKAQFVHLERRVAELEEENKRLRAGLPPADPVQDAKDRENQELRARIATLERGLEAVVKAFAVQGLPSSLPPTDVSSPAKSSDSIPTFSAESPIPTLSPSSSTSSISTPSSTGSPAPESFPISPSPSHASLDFSFTSVSPTASRESESSESTRHLARVATTQAPCVSLQRVNSSSTPLTSTISKPTTLPPISQQQWTPSMMRQWKHSSMKSSAATLAHLRLNLATPEQGQRPQRVYKLLICSRLPSKCKGTRRRRRPPVLQRRK
ncbi:hypothetical protein PM082_000798 [Marasmius tenuissimus]|nr:hypothetical protein PM082_000798 [Marasmius tenuissimus]